MNAMKPISWQAFLFVCLQHVLLLITGSLLVVSQPFSNEDQAGKPFYYEDEDGRIMEVRRSGLPIHKRQCDCFCLVAGDTSSIHCCIECHITDTVCFPGSAYVTRPDGGSVKMADLQIGDEILTASTTGEIETTDVLGFITYDPEVIGRYRKLTLDTGDYILLSRSHLVYASDVNISSQAAPTFAGHVTAGQYLFLRKGNFVVPRLVTSSVAEGHKGAYVPLTSSGTLLVNNIMSSSYAAFPHDLAHAFFAPMRWFPWLLGSSPPEGDHAYVTFLKALGRVIVPGKGYKTDSSNVTAETVGLSQLDIFRQLNVYLKDTL